MKKNVFKSIACIFLGLGSCFSFALTSCSQNNNQPITGEWSVDELKTEYFNNMGGTYFYFLWTTDEDFLGYRTDLTLISGENSLCKFSNIDQTKISCNLLIKNVKLFKKDDQTQSENVDLEFSSLKQEINFFNWINWSVSADDNDNVRLTFTTKEIFSDNVLSSLSITDYVMINKWHEWGGSWGTFDAELLLTFYDKQGVPHTVLSSTGDFKILNFDITIANC